MVRATHLADDIGDRIRTMVDRIVLGFDPDKIILFGSIAQGTAHADSDIDLLVIAPVSGSKRQTRVAMRVALHDIPGSFDILLSTPEEMKRRSRIVGTIERAALRDGREVYAKKR